MLVAAVALACQPSFDAASELSGLRVLAVQKSKPYVVPGERVELTMLWHDAGTAQREPRVPQIAWLAICENPASDLFELCLSQVPQLSPDQLADRIAPPAPGNERFAFTTSEDLISSRPPPRDPSIRRYGLTYVFFAACAGQLEQAEGDRFPFVCYEEQDGEAGFTDGDVEYSSENFVVGYSAVFAYESSQNQNPIVTGIEFDGMRLLPEGSEAEVDEEAVYLPPEDLCVGTNCRGLAGTEASGPCAPELTREACDGDCPQFDLRAIADPASAEVDDTTLQRSSDLEEQMWVSYYATAGQLGSSARLLNDATLGWNEDHGTTYEPAEEPGVHYVWGVAHDNRGGTSWARLRLCTR